MAIREVDVILYCGQPSTTSGDVCQDMAQSEDDCTLLSSTEGGEYVCYKIRKSFFFSLMHPFQTEFEYLGCYDDNPQ